MLVGAALCLRPKWPEKWQPYFYHFGYFAVIVTGPFTFVFTALQHGGGTIAVGNTLLAAVVVLMLTDWRNMIVIMITGIAAATLLYVGTDPDPRMPVDYVQRLPILIAVMLIGVGKASASPPSEPCVRFSRIRCGRPHLVRNVALAHMWRPAVAPLEGRSRNAT
jgi:hypothetical protein